MSSVRQSQQATEMDGTQVILLRNKIRSQSQLFVILGRRQVCWVRSTWNGEGLLDILWLTRRCYCTQEARLIYRAFLLHGDH